MTSPKAASTSDRWSTSATAKMIDLCRQTIHPPELIVVGASTGGPTALVALLSALKPSRLPIPTCVTLHMPPELMSVIAAQVASYCDTPVQVVTRNRELVPGRVHFAPGDRHLTFLRCGDRVDLVPMPRECFGSKLSVDVMFTSAAELYARRTIGAVLSGMGKDGLEGSRAIVAAGGAVLAQDKATSAVWGMPGAVAQAQLASAILEPAEIAKDILKRLGVSRAAV